MAYREGWIQGACLAALLSTTALAGCKDDGDGDGGSNGEDETAATQTDGSASTSGDTSTQGGPGGPTGVDTNDPDSGDPDTSDPDTSSDDTPVTPGALPYEEDFEGADGDSWPDPWRAIGSHVISYDISGGQGRFNGNTSNVARIELPGFDESDIEATLTVVFDNWNEQGFGFYARQNGGALTETNPPGQGYAVYVEGGFQQEIGIWRELEGVEEILQGAPVPGGSIAPGTPYRIRFQCVQEGSETRLRSRVWPEGEAEPDAWQVDILDDTAPLQGASGGFAVDVYNYVGTGNVYVDDLRIEAI